MAQNNNKRNGNGFWQVDLQEFVCGWGASFINIAITYPLYKVMFRQVGLFFFLNFEIIFGQMRFYFVFDHNVLIFFRCSMELK